MKKVLLLVCVVFLLASCGYSEADVIRAKNEGYQSGFEEGYDLAKYEAKGTFESALEEEINDAYERGYEHGYEIGYDDGYSDCQYGEGPAPTHGARIEK